MENYLDILSQELKKIGIKNYDNILEKFQIYTDYMLEYNSHTNLTRITDKDEIAIKHYIDSISILKYIDIKENAKIIDIGTGAGFPLVPVKILRDDLKVTLLDSLKKRIIFLENLMKKLDLDAEIIHARAEDYARKEEYREKYDYAAVRAVANLNVLIEYIVPFLKKNGKLIALKGENALEEIDGAKKSLKILNSKVIDIIDVENNTLNHKIILIEKTGETPYKYPRPFSKIKKKPL